MRKNGHYFELTDENFDEQVMQSDQLILINFCAEWSGSSHMMAPILEQMAVEYDGKVKFARLDFEKFNNLTQQFGLWKVPRLLLVKGGRLIDSLNSLVARTELDEYLKKLLLI